MTSSPARIRSRSSVRGAPVIRAGAAGAALRSPAALEQLPRGTIAVADADGVQVRRIVFQPGADRARLDDRREREDVRRPQRGARHRRSVRAGRRDWSRRRPPPDWRAGHWLEASALGFGPTQRVASTAPGCRRRRRGGRADRCGRPAPARRSASARASRRGRRAACRVPRVGHRLDARRATGRRTPARASRSSRDHARPAASGLACRQRRARLGRVFRRRRRARAIASREPRAAACPRG